MENKKEVSKTGRMKAMMDGAQSDEVQISLPAR
jgi:hypothetical protein